MKSHSLFVSLPVAGYLLLAPGALGEPQSVPSQTEKKKQESDPPPQEPQKAEAKKAPAKPREFRLFINGGYNASSLSFNEARRFTLFLEEATFSSRYRGGRGPVFEVGALYTIRNELGVGGAVEIHGSGYDADFQQALPHPFFFRRPRQVSGNLVDLSYSETAVHLDAVYTRPLRPQMTLDLFGGPSFLLTSTEVLANLVVEDVYPFDAVTLQRTELRKLDASPLGFNVGASVTYKLSARFGVDFTARFSRAKVEITPPGGAAIDFNAGGFRAGGGIRILLSPVISSPPPAKEK
jgi:hypothetical protein